MSGNLRRQLTLFLDEEYSFEIEKIRQKYNPVQFNLIKSHVTLCREDEMTNMIQILENIKSLNQKSISIHFEKIVRFSDKKGVQISADKNNTEYHKLRQETLKNIYIPIKLREPHITLMHPRNSTCTHQIFTEIQKLNFPTLIKFEKISFIEQINGGKWKILEQFSI